MHMIESLAMRRTRRFSPLSWLSVIALLAALVLLALQLVSFSRLRASFPTGMRIASVPVGGLDRQQSAQRLLEVYTIPVAMRYGEDVIQLDPSVVGFELDLEGMLAAADLERTGQSFWIDFWGYLWEREASTAAVPLSASYSEARLRTFLKEEIATRYDKPPIPALPAAGTINFTSGQPGTALDIDRSVALIETALESTAQRTIDLPLQRTAPTRPSMQNLEILLKQTIDRSGFDGISGLYLLDLQTAQEIHFLYRQGEDLPTSPDLAFTAASIIKIPIMVSSFRRVDNPSEETQNLIFLMIDKSGNEAADWLMDRVITTGITPGPLGVTADMETLGLQSTFLAGYFYAGAPLLTRIETPANQRTDVLTDPDLYNQTTPSEIGILLADIYHCAESGGGSLIAAFSGAITQAECRTMIDYLLQNRIAVLFEAGTPDGTKIAHKHGWVSDIYGVTKTVGDAGIIYTPGGDFVLVIFVNHPEQLIWDSAADLIAELTRAVYNYYNMNTP